MSNLSEKQQHQITAEHLRNGMGIEVWLIPFSITVSLVLIFIVIIVILHLLKQKKYNPDPAKQQMYSQAQVTDILQEGIILQINTSRVKASPMVYFSKSIYSGREHARGLEEQKIRKNNAKHQKYSQANTADSDEMLTFPPVGSRDEPSLPNGNCNSNNSRENETNVSSRSYLWPPQSDSNPSNESPWTGLPSSNL